MATRTLPEQQPLTRPAVPLPRGGEANPSSQLKRSGPQPTPATPPGASDAVAQQAVANWRATLRRQWALLAVIAALFVVSVLAAIFLGDGQSGRATPPGPVPAQPSVPITIDPSTGQFYPGQAADGRLWYPADIASLANAPSGR
jgi:hypothetical protein